MTAKTRRVFGIVLLIAVGAAVGLGAARAEPTAPDPNDPKLVARGKVVYDQHCAACHGANLEGQPDWRHRLPNGRMPAPPHDDNGHTWHHPDDVLFGITKNGLVPPYAPRDYESDMPAFGGKLADDEIWTVLAFIKSKWSAQVLPLRAEMTRNAKR